MKPVVVIGTGLAGYTFAREWRKHDAETPLVMITADGGEFYSKPMLSSALSQGKSVDALVMSDVQGMENTLTAEILVNTRVEHVDAAQQVVQAGSRQLEYSALVLATGASVIRLPLKGDGAEDVISINSLQDYRRFREMLENTRRIALIGPGLIGCEFANDLVSSGKSVDIIGPDPYPLSTLLPEAAGRALQQGLEEAGVNWHLETVTGDISRKGKGYTIELQNGEIVESDLVLSAVGLRPDLTLANLTGLETNRGIVVDRSLATSERNIYALGDCAEVDGLNLPFVAPLMQAARALAVTLSGSVTEVAYPAMPVVVKTTLHPVVVSPPAGEGEWVIQQGEGGVRALFRDANGSLLGFALTGDAVAEKQSLTRQLPPVLS
jgi:rubredoxin-NAD+ reductase